MSKVVLVTSKWNREGDRDFCKREKELKERHWRELLLEGRGAHVMRLDPSRGEGRSAWDVIRHILVKLDSRLSHKTLDDALQIQYELVKEKKLFSDTRVGIDLREQLRATLGIQEEMLALEAQAAEGDEVAEAKIREKDEKLREAIREIKNSPSFKRPEPTRSGFWGRCLDSLQVSL